MQPTFPNISKVDSPQDAENARALFEGHYPGLKLSMQGPGKGFWLIHASGPCGSYTLNSPSPLRGESLTALCEMACTSNLGKGDV